MVGTRIEVYCVAQVLRLARALLGAAIATAARQITSAASRRQPTRSSFRRSLLPRSHLQGLSLTQCV